MSFRASQSLSDVALAKLDASDDESRNRFAVFKEFLRSSSDAFGFGWDDKYKQRSPRRKVKALSPSR
jgi:hypothetical protein